MPRPRKTSRPAISASTTATSKPCLKIRFRGQLLAHLQSFDREPRIAFGEAINRARDAWGKPHLHAGAGIRKLTPRHYECRAGLSLRFVFEDLGKDGLFFLFLGNHDQVQNFADTLR